MKKTILILGASGFIGTHLINYLHALGEYNLVGLDLLPPETPVPSVRYIIGDVRDLSSFDLDGEIALIVNLAAVHKTPGHPAPAYYETNILGAVETCKFARRKGVKDIIFTSSISVYGPGEETKTESSALAPNSPYGWSKMMAERIHRSWLEENEENRLVICRPAVIFGHKEGGNFTRLAKLMQKGLFIYPGRKDTIKACFYVKDLIDALMFAWKQPERFVLFNGCYPDRYTIEQIVKTFKATYFPKVKEYMVPHWVLMAIATLLRPISTLGIGIHPERVTKLVISTDISPEWLLTKGQSKRDALASAFKDWDKDSNGTFR